MLKKKMSDDLISREATINKIMNLPTAGSRPFVSYEAVIKIIFDLSLAQPEQKWIPCSKMLPKKEKKTYWVCTDTEYQCECRWTNNRFGLGEGEWGWSIFDTPRYSKPIAWMPLPEPYREERVKE